jgi:hypothetical protein
MDNDLKNFVKDLELDEDDKKSSAFNKSNNLY